jgi:S-DNA-T family DNA segregation ATPase FtsK/SpoIIIE
VLLVSLVAGRRVHDVAIDCPPEAEVGLVVDSLLAQLGRAGVDLGKASGLAVPTLRVTSGSAPPIARSERLIAADLHDGDVVSIVAEAGGSRPPRAVATLTVLSGPERGKVLPVAPGESRIGRDRAYADLVLADPTISRVHALLRVSDAIEVADAGSTNGIEIDGRVIDGTLRIEPGQSFTIGDTELVVGRVDEASAHASLSVPFNPTPRIYEPFGPVALEYPAPPTKPARPPIPWMSAFIPLIVGIGLALATRSLLFLAFMAMSPLLIFAATFENRREQAKQHAEAMEDHEEAIAELVAQHTELQQDEVRRRHEGSPAMTELAGWAPRRDLRLWERGAAHGDVLSLRIGTADLPSRVLARVASGGRPRDRKRLVAQVERTKTLPGLPVTADLLPAGHVGIAGAESAASLARALVAQAAVLHSPANLTIAAVVAAGAAGAGDGG